MAKRTEVYLDTSAFISFLDRSDTYHELFRQLFVDPPAIYTTSLVIAEGHAWFLRRYDTFRSIQFLNFIEDMSLLEIVSVGKKELTKGALLIKKFSDQKLTLVDAVGLYLMAEYRTPLCWSTDHHLRLTGVPLVIHEK